MNVSFAGDLFADDFVLLASSETYLQCCLDRFAAECDVTGMRINGEAVEELEKFKYLGIVFTGDEKQRSRSTGGLTQSVAFCVN
ncbi:unnamed protein product [Soboliphyme baturini]|uniref:Reverse transcriptase domain-containing protein n=1 Tax=Soboliphyme baturini TaxID=241478 RepID=A0A183ITA6_9BILA|nr:unnamed protein product [Soboliphyme baturini]